MRIPGPVAFLAGVAGALYIGPRIIPMLAGAGEADDNRDDAPTSSSDELSTSTVVTPEPATANVSSSPDVVTPAPFGDPYTGATYGGGL